MKWNVAGRWREVWEKDGRVEVVYFDSNSENAIAWPLERDRRGEPYPTNRLRLMELAGQGWRRVD